MACHSINSGWAECRKWKAQAEFTYVALFSFERIETCFPSAFFIAECMFFLDKTVLQYWSYHLKKTLDVFIWYACRHLHARPRFNLHQGFWVARVHSFFLVTLYSYGKRCSWVIKLIIAHEQERRASGMECWRGNKEVFLTIVGKPYYSYMCHII